MRWGELSKISANFAGEMNENSAGCGRWAKIVQLCGGIDPLVWPATIVVWITFFPNGLT
jgi:hypothetical protein